MRYEVTVSSKLGPTNKLSATTKGSRIMRLRQDLLGCANRIRAATNDWSEQSQLLKESWRDERGEAFAVERIEPGVARLQKLIHALQAAGELAQQLDKRLYDPGLHGSD